VSNTTVPAESTSSPRNITPPILLHKNTAHIPKPKFPQELSQFHRGHEEN